MQYSGNAKTERTTARQDSKMEPTKRAATCISGKRISIHGRIRVMKGLILLLCVFLLPVSAVEAAGPAAGQINNAAVSEGEIEGSAAETDSTGENAGSTENGTGTSGEGETENGAETEGEGKTEDSTETGTETDGESETETGTENESGNSGEGETESGDETETDEGGEIETETETETEFEEETQELPLEEEVVLLDAPMAVDGEVTSAADLYKWGIEVTTGGGGFIITRVSDKNKLPSVLRLPDDIEDIKADVFRGCDGIEEVILPDLFTGARSGIFADCINLKKISFGRQFCISQPRAFTGCSSLQEIDLSRVESKSNLVTGTFDLGITDGSQCLEVLRLNHKLLDGKYANLFSDMPVKHLYVYDSNLTAGSFSDAMYYSCKDVFDVLDNMGIRIEKLESIDAVIMIGGQEVSRSMSKSFHREMIAKEYMRMNLGVLPEEELWEMCFGEDTEISADFTGVLPTDSTGTGLTNYANFIDFYKDFYNDSNNGLWDAATKAAMDGIYAKVLQHIEAKADALKAKSDKINIVEQETAQKSTNEPAELPLAEAFVLSGENPALEEGSTNGVPAQVEDIQGTSGTTEPESEEKEPETDETNSEAEPETEGSNTHTKPETEESNTEQETEEPDINSEPETGETDQEPETDETNTGTDVPQEETNVLPEDELLEKEELNLELINEEPVTEVMVTSTDVTSPADLGNWGIVCSTDNEGYHIIDVFDKTLLPQVLEIPNGVISIGVQAFKDCDTIEQVILPDSVKYIFAEAFGDCNNLNVVRAGTGLEEIKIFAFQGCNSLREVDLHLAIHLNVLEEKCFSSTGRKVLLQRLLLNTNIAGGNFTGSFGNIGLKCLEVYNTEQIYTVPISERDLYVTWMNVFRESDSFGWDVSQMGLNGAICGVMEMIGSADKMQRYSITEWVHQEMIADYYANVSGISEMGTDEIWDTCFGEKSAVSADFTGVLPPGETGITSYSSFAEFCASAKPGSSAPKLWSNETLVKMDGILNKLNDVLKTKADLLSGWTPDIMVTDADEQIEMSVRTDVQQLQILPKTEPETVIPSAAADSQPMETVDSNTEKGQNMATAEQVAEETQNVPPAEPIVEETQNVPPAEPAVEEAQNIPPAELVVEETQNVPPAEPVVEGAQNVPPAEPVIEETQDVPPVEPVAEEPQIPAPIEPAVPEPPIYVPAGAADSVTEAKEVMESVPADMILEEVPLHVHIPQETPDVLTEAEAAFRQMAEWGITTSWNEAGDLVVVGVADASSMPSPEVLAEYGINVSGTGLNPGQIICAAN